MILEKENKLGFDSVVGKVQVVKTRTAKGFQDWRYAAGCPSRKCWSPWMKRRAKAEKNLKCTCVLTNE